jgi:glycosyltransferase involved in cell wall biosynthesis
MSSRVLEFPPAGTVIQLGRAAGAATPGADCAERAPLTRREDAPARLRIRMLAPRVDVGGGARVLLEHANRLCDRGHDVVVLAHFPPPDWFDLRARYRHVPVGLSLADALDPCDLVVCGYWDQVAAARAAAVAPVVHFEQGDRHLFEELADDVQAFVQRHLELADATNTVSAQVGAVLGQRYGIEDVAVVHNAVDATVFGLDGARFRIGGAGAERSQYVLCVGWDGNEFKGMDEVRRVWMMLQDERPELNLVWVTPQPPLRPMGRVVVTPSQAELAALYRGASVYLCASRYESFPLPPLEAMACGAPVVTTANVGVLEYAREGENAIVVPIGDVEQMATSICRVLDDRALAASLRAGGARTAASFSWEQIIAGLEERYRDIARWRLDVTGTSAWERVLTSAVEAQPGAAARLQWSLATSTAAEILVPVVRPAIEGHDVASWEVIARRAAGSGSVRVHAPHRVEERGSLPYQAGIDALDSEQPAAAVEVFTRHLRATRDRASQGALAKWVALSLFESEQTDAALNVLESALQAFPDNPDYTYLAAIIGASTGCAVDLDHARLNLALIGEGRRYCDWFVDPTARLTERLAA